ncbi:hypothetical protein FRD01_03685 [Microvenator marinus]|uniref:Uncharacterized protein n=1 Tax=Microvenator marinus TaxID=2600177 RepID=A0A5B8XQR0_9DELT|nr:hypothetical protein FRD01_03685 [Microvenator marinus]
MNEDYKQKFLCALEKQKKSFSPTIEDQNQQIMKMNGWTSLKTISLLELLSSNGLKASTQTSAQVNSLNSPEVGENT